MGPVHVAFITFGIPTYLDQPLHTKVQPCHGYLAVTCVVLQVVGSVLSVLPIAVLAVAQGLLARSLALPGNTMYDA